MRLLVNQQLIPIAIQPKSISLEQICYLKVLLQLPCIVFLFDVKKQRPKTSLEKCYQLLLILIIQRGRKNIMCCIMSFPYLLTYLFQIQPLNHFIISIGLFHTIDFLIFSGSIGIIHLVSTQHFPKN